MPPTAAQPLADPRALAGSPVLVPYDGAWPAAFEQAKTVILRAAGDLLAAVEHVGSTAVPGLAAKPYLDIMPGLRRHEDGERLAERMRYIGYAYKGEYGIPGRHYFSRWTTGDAHIWKHNVHCYEAGHPEWERHLVFRDALRADPATRDAYAALKADLAARHPDDIEAYADAKSSFVEAVVARAAGPSRYERLRRAWT